MIAKGQHQKDKPGCPSRADCKCPVKRQGSRQGIQSQLQEAPHSRVERLSWMGSAWAPPCHQTLHLGSPASWLAEALPVHLQEPAAGALQPQVQMYAGEHLGFISQAT